MAQALPDAAPLKLYAWLGHKNFGDELSPYIVSRISNLGLRLVAAEEPDKLVALGSVVTVETLYSGSRFWGSGVLDEEISLKRPRFKLFPLNHLVSNTRRWHHFHKLPWQPQFCALRGPLSAARLAQCGFKLDGGGYHSRINYLKCTALPTGDPGILMPYLYQPKRPAQRFQLGVILHHTQEHLAQELSALVAARYREQVTVISIFRSGEAELEQFVDELCACDRIASTSLHGLILAQAYGIPMLFLQSADCPVQRHSTFKFDDYCQGVGAPNFEPYRFTLHDGLIEELQNLLESFPYQDSLKLTRLP